MPSNNVNQRDVYLLPHPFDREVCEHPFIVLSTNESNNHENTFVAVMITSSKEYYDDYSFDLTDEMFERPLIKSDSHVRMHLITLCLTEDISGYKKNTMKSMYFKQLMQSIGDLIFNYNFEPK